MQMAVNQLYQRIRTFGDFPLANTVDMIATIALITTKQFVVVFTSATFHTESAVLALPGILINSSYHSC